MSTLEIIRDERKQETGEVFTPPELTNEILDKLPSDVWEENKTFCDPACGNGNILIEIYKRKLLHEHSELVALSTLYGVDLMDDNIIEIKQRFLELIPKDYHTCAIRIMNKNFICHDALTWDFINWKSTILKNKKLF